MATVIYRYKFSDDIYTIITSFATVHQFDERKDYKDAWKVLVESYKVEFAVETDRLIKQGYKGDVLDKMYKSGRYYFKGKSPTDKIKPRSNKMASIKLSNYMLELIDSHIKSNSKPVKPSDRYDAFCRDNKEIIDREIANLDCVESELMTKIKKSYKNRYFTIQKKKDIS